MRTINNPLYVLSQFLIPWIRHMDKRWHNIQCSETQDIHVGGREIRAERLVTRWRLQIMILLIKPLASSFLWQQQEFYSWFILWLKARETWCLSWWGLRWAARGKAGYGVDWRCGARRESHITTPWRLLRAGLRSHSQLESENAF